MLFLRPKAVGNGTSSKHKTASVQFSRSVVSDSSRPNSIYHGKRARSMLFTVARAFLMQGHCLEDVAINLINVYSRTPVLPVSQFQCLLDFVDFTHMCEHAHTHTHIHFSLVVVVV